MVMLAGVCSFFNPCDYKARIVNYDIFRQAVERSGIRLLTIELLFDWQQSSAFNSADVVTIRGGDLLWQKERLLQIGIDRLLNDGVDGVVWLDADIMFQKPDWADRIKSSLDEYDCVQSYEVLWPYYSRSNRERRTIFQERFMAATGGSWAARSEFWRAAPLYQHCIVGGGDHIMAYMFADLDKPPAERGVWRYQTHTMQRLNPIMRKHVTAWAQAIKGDWKVWYVPDQKAYLLPHGQEPLRKYSERHFLLADFDPGTDVAMSESGAWRWSSNKPDLHNSIADYFNGRMEDVQ